MKTIFLLSFISSISFAQVVKPPIYSFEKLQWGQSVAKAKESLAGKTIKDATQFLGLPPGYLGYIYRDKISGYSVGVELTFSKGQLTSIGVTIGPSLDQQEIDSLWNEFSTRFGKSYKEKKTATGKSDTWSFAETIFIMDTMSKGDGILKLDYVPNAKQK